MGESSSTFDLAIIGGGPGGYVAAIKAAQLGIKTALIEKDKVGGTCLHRGCIPTKVLLHTAELYNKFLKAKEFGISANSVRIEYSQIQRRMEFVIKRLFLGIQALLKKNGIEVISGEGQLTSPHNILITKNGTDIGKINAKHIILATGSAPYIPDSIKPDGKLILTSDDILRLDELPKSIIIAGGGAIGAEFAFFYNTLGTKVTVIELLGEILPAEDKEISTIAKKIFTKHGIDVLINTSLQSVEINGTGIRVGINRKNISPPFSTSNESVEYLNADCLLLALGRRPVLTNLGIEELSINSEGKYLQTNDVTETNIKGVYAIGDIAGPPLLAHKASYEGILAVSHIANKTTTSINYQNIPRVTYCYPQVASTGFTQDEAENKGYKIKTGKFPFIANSKAIVDGEYNEGFIKVITDDTYGEILGVHAIGPNVGEMMWGINLSAILEGTVYELSQVIFPHPTLSETLLEAARTVIDKPIHI